MPITATWTCEAPGCTASTTEPAPYGENVWTPNDGTFNWCRDELGEHIFCRVHYQEWLDKIHRENPNTVWIA